MRKWMLIVALVLAATALASVAFAQDATPTPEPAVEESTAPADDADSAEVPVADTEAVEAEAAITTTQLAERQAYVTLDLQTGFPLDPFIVSVNGGGPVDAATLADECTGAISENPVLTINWEGEAEFASIFFFSDHDPTLVIQDPSGAFLCNDDASPLVQDPMISGTAPASGTYRVWVGNAEDTGLIPGLLVVTERPDITAGTFTLAGLVRRPAIRESAEQALAEIPGSEMVQRAVTRALARSLRAVPLQEGQTLTATATVTGSVPGFLWPVAEASPLPACSGVSNAEAQLQFALAEDTESVTVFFEGDADATLIVLAPDGTAFCADDTPNDDDSAPNLNPSLTIEAPEPGTYAVVVGRIQSESEVSGVVTVTLDPDAAPALHSLPADE